MEPEPEPESDTLARPNQSLSNLVLIPSEDLKFGKKIGSGTYGVVYQAELRGATDVAVKAARGEPDSIDKIIKDLGQEIMQCQRLNHVVRPPSLCHSMPTAHMLLRRAEHRAVHGRVQGSAAGSHVGRRAADDGH